VVWNVAWLSMATGLARCAHELGADLLTARGGAACWT